jgi:hypothetical protein
MLSGTLMMCRTRVSWRVLGMGELVAIGYQDIEPKVGMR